VAQSRQPVFYAEWGIPDTVTGRFDMISLHLSLLFRRLRVEKQAGAEFSQALFDLFFKDMDRSLREMGAGDMAVPKKVRKMSEIFYGLMTSLNEAMDRDDRPGVEAVLRRNVYGEADSAEVGKLADYLFTQYDKLAAQPLAGIVGGRLEMAAAA
jgi:cytochrome b pre-mRNA-processing protein 3